LQIVETSNDLWITQFTSHSIFQTTYGSYNLQVNGVKGMIGF